MAKVLYISLTGMTEPLGESQVVQYLLELAKHNSIYLVSFEKPTDKEKHQQMKEKLENANIQWKCFEYSNRYGVLSSGWQISSAFFVLGKWIKQEKIELAHARSLIPAVIGTLLKKFFNIKLLFDIRGFAIDEKIMDGRLKQNSFLTRWLKKLEAYVYRQADHIVTLTHASKPIITEQYLVSTDNITVIPTCANLNLFKPIPIAEKISLREEIGFSKNDYIILHHGSLNGWIDFEAEIKLFKQLSFLDANIKFLFLNKGQHPAIFSHLKKYQFNEDSFKVLSVDFDKAGQYLNLADLHIFFIKPLFAKQASAPTKFAEAAACHLYSVTNRKYGDLEYYLKLYDVGFLLDLQNVHDEPNMAASAVMEVIEARRKNPMHNAKDFDNLCATHFSKEIAVERYQHLYNQLTQSIQ